MLPPVQPFKRLESGLQFGSDYPVLSSPTKMGRFFLRPKEAAICEIAGHDAL